MNVTLRQLVIFLKVVDLKSITRAAEELHLSQPAVSIQLKKLQEQFDEPLTQLNGRQLEITPFGHDIADSARRVAAEMEEISYKTERFRGKIAGRLHLSVASTAKYVMPYFLAGFMREHPAVDLTMNVTNKRLVVRSLEDNEVDFSLVSVLPTRPQLERRELIENKLLLVARRGLISPQDATLPRLVANYPLLFREPGSATRDAMEDYLKGQDLPAVKRIELTSNEAVKQAILAGLGISIVPLIGLKDQLAAGELDIIPLPALPIVTHWNLVWRSDKKLSPVAAAYLDYVEQNKAAIAATEFAWIKAYA